MALFNSITNAGIKLLSKAAAGATIHFTKMVLGDGKPSASQNPASMTRVISPKATIDIVKHEVDPSSSTAVVGGVYTNASENTGFFYRELGLYARDPDAGEILYAYASNEDYAEWIPPTGESRLIEKQIEVRTFIGSASKVTASINASSYATLAMIDSTNANVKDQKNRVKVLEKVARSNVVTGILRDGSNPITTGGAANEVIAFDENPIKDLSNRVDKNYSYLLAEDKRISNAHNLITTKADKTYADEIDYENQKQNLRIKSLEKQQDAGKINGLVLANGSYIALAENSSEFLMFENNVKADLEKEIQRLEKYIKMLQSQITRVAEESERKLKKETKALSDRITVLEAAEEK